MNKATFNGVLEKLKEIRGLVGDYPFVNIKFRGQYFNYHRSGRLKISGDVVNVRGEKHHFSRMLKLSVFMPDKTVTVLYDEGAS